MRFFPFFIGEIVEDSEKIKGHWENDFSYLFCYKETTTILLICLFSIIYMDEELIFNNPTLYLLWISLVFYGFMGFIISQTITLFIVLRSKSLCHKGLLITAGVMSLLYTTLGGACWLHIVCTTPGFSPPPFPWVLSYQEDVFGFQAPTAGQLVVGKLYLVTTGGELPPLKEGTKEVDYFKTMELLKKHTGFKRNFILFLVTSITTPFPFTKRIFSGIMHDLRFETF